VKRSDASVAAPPLQTIVLTSRCFPLSPSSLAGKPKESDWRGMVDCPHYSQIKSWPEKDYPFTLDARLPRQMSGAARDILLKMLAYDPGQRITAEQALAHPYFREDPKPMANVFKDANGGTIQVKVRETKPMNASKRGREAEAANGQAQQHHHQQQQQRMALQQVYHQAHLQQQSSQEAATATLAASSAAAAPSLQLPQAHSLARVGSYDPNGVPIMSQYQGMDGTSGGGGGGHGRSGSLQQFSQHPNTMLYGASSSVDMPPMLPAQAQAVISQRFNHLLAQNNTQGDKEMFERQLMQQVSGAGANANLQGPPAKVRKVD
jgi:serine/threonine protein kinase